MQYDKHGNITYMIRGTDNYWTDMLSLAYNGNQLAALGNEYADINGANVVEYPSDKSTFTYNANGALTSDSGRGIATIQYNSLNLPRLVQFTNGNQIRYTYTGDGIKLKVQHITAKQGVVQPVTNGQVRELTASQISNTLITDYIGNIIVTSDFQGQNTTNPVSKKSKILYNGGYDEYGQGGTPDSHYQLTDYLGNVRSTINNIDKNYEVTEYHAFGTPFRRFKGEMSSDPMKFTGKEFDRMHGYNKYDSKARTYDSLFGRFDTMDPLAEKYYSISPYAYAGNNPIRNIDINGDSISVLNMGGGLDQHMAILIQNDKGKWQYYSINGTTIFDKTNGMLGGGPVNDLGEKEFNSPEEFINSPFNKIAESKEDKENKDEMNGYGFTEAYTLPTTPKQDDIIRNTFTNIANNEEYSLTKPNHCATITGRSIESGGIKATQTKPNPLPFGTTMAESRPYLPSTTFHVIMKNNPNGNYLKKR